MMWGGLSAFNRLYCHHNVGIQRAEHGINGKRRHRYDPVVWFGGEGNFVFDTIRALDQGVSHDKTALPVVVDVFGGKVIFSAAVCAFHGLSISRGEGFLK